MNPTTEMRTGKILIGDALKTLRGMESESVHCCVTSPPYWGLRDYGVAGQLGLESTPEAFVAKMVELFAEVRRVLRDDGTCWVNLGDSYATQGGRGEARMVELGRPSPAAKQIPEASGQPSGTKRGDGLKPKDLIGIPWRVALALQADGWYLRSDIIWHKPNPMPESCTDRPTKAHEYLFLLSKSARYFYDADAIRETPSTPGLTQGSPGGSQKTRTDRDGASNDLERSGQYCGVGGRNRRTVWTVPTHSFSGAHFATFPPKLIEPCILAGCPDRCCAECGAPWMRVVEKTKSFESGSGKSGNPIAGKHGEKCQGGGDTGDIRKGPTISTKTTGHRPTCDCNGATTAGTVLDPFLGAGTTGLVACELARRWIGIELSPDYAEMARKRIAPVDAQGDLLRIQ